MSRSCPSERGRTVDCRSALCQIDRPFGWRVDAEIFNDEPIARIATGEDMTGEECSVRELQSVMALSHIDGVGRAPNRLPNVPDTLRKDQPTKVSKPAGRADARRWPVNRKVANTVLRLNELGVTAGEIKRWAHNAGIITTTSGRVSLATIEAWAEAHPHADHRHAS